MSRKKNLEEALSAFMDNEASEFEYRRLLKEAEKDGSLKAKWARYHLISTAIKGQYHSSPDLLPGIHRQLNLDAEALNPPRRMPRETARDAGDGGWMKSILQGGIAASVAVAVLFTADFVTRSAPGNNDAVPEMAGNTTSLNDDLPEFNGSYTPTEFSRVVNYENLEEAAADRLRQAVYQEFGNAPENARETPVSFNLPDADQ